MNSSTHSYQVGDATVTRIPELNLSQVPPHDLFPDLGTDTLAEYGRQLTPGSYDPRAGHFALSIHTWFVRRPGRTILVDTSTGNDKDVPENPALDHLHGPFLARFAAAGVRPDEVDTVLHTHLHVDHIGWNTHLEGGRWVPTFPNARHVFSRREQRYLASLYSGTAAPDLPPPGMGAPTKQPYQFIYEQSVVPIMQAALAELIDVDGTERSDGFTYLPTPGHSVDHASIRLRSQGQEALFLGDVLHHPLQVYRPDLRSVYCEFPEPARASRRWVLEYAAAHDCLCLTSHMAETSAGYVRREGDGYRWQFA